MARPLPLMALFVRIIGLFAVLLQCQAAIFTDPSTLPRSTYDFIVVGGGTAGSVLANRLSAFSPNISVLVIEAGISNDGVLPTIVPFLAPSLVPASPETWNFTTVPQVGLADRILAYARGKLLGGSSSVNFMTYTRPSTDDFDRFAEITGDSGWAWNNLVQFFNMSERMVPPGNSSSLDSVIAQNQALPQLHGNGLVEVSVPAFPTPLDHRVIDTARTISNLTLDQIDGGQAGSLIKGGDVGFGFNEDYLSGALVGTSFAQSTIGNSRRSSAAVAYLDTPGVLNRKNLDVLILTQVNRLIRTSNGTSQTPRWKRSGSPLPEFKAVEVQQTSSSPSFVFHANCEVVLSAGSIGSAQILLLSGIGNATTLANIASKSNSSFPFPDPSQLIDLPDVGQHLHDHPALSTYFAVNSSLPNSGTFDDTVPGRDVNGTVGAALLDEWMQTGGGLFADSLTNTVGFYRLAEGSQNVTGRENVPSPGFPFTNAVNPDTNSGVGIFKLVGDKEVVPNAPGLGTVAGVAGQDPSSGRRSAHYELIFIDFFAPTTNPIPPTGSFISIVLSVVSPLSRGSVELASLDPFEFPIIDPALLSHPYDKAAIVRAMRAAQGFISGGGGKAGTGVRGGSWNDGFVLEPILGLIDIRDRPLFSVDAGPLTVEEQLQMEAEDAALLEYAAQNTETIWHPVGTVRMSPENATWGVVDPRLRVKKVDGVRVVDAGVFPVVTAGHPVAAVYIFAERAAQLIKEDWGL